MYSWVGFINSVYKLTCFTEVTNEFLWCHSSFWWIEKKCVEPNKLSIWRFEYVKSTAGYSLHHNYLFGAFWMALRKLLYIFNCCLGFGDSNKGGDQVHEPELHRIQVSPDKTTSMAQGICMFFFLLHFLCLCHNIFFFSS